MSKLSEIKLGREAIEYCKDRLAAGKTLASFLLARPDLGDGAVVAFLPRNIDPVKIGNFSEGGVLATPPPGLHHHYPTPHGSTTRLIPVPDTSSCLTSMIEEFLKQGERRVCLFESAVASPGDAFLSLPEAQDLHVLGFGPDVYYFLAKDGLEEQKIGKTIRYAKSYLVIGVLAELAKADEFLPLKQKVTRGEITRQELKLLAERTQKIIVGAYDGEAYLIWSEG